MRRKIKWILFFQFSFLASIAFGSGTGVGNGGDPVFEFMSAVRSSMVESIKVLLNSPAEQSRFCQSEKLSAEQIGFCRQFFISVAPEILRLNTGTERVPFVLRQEPLTVEGPDGKPMVVAARTALGPEGPIELHRDSVKTLLPTQVLFLITHEFQHKVTYEGRNVTDNEKIGPFASGRDLIDAAATSVVTTARRNGKIGTQFGIRDIFDCRAFTADAQFGARLSASRLFDGDDLLSYQTSLGKNPNDGSVFIPESVNTVLSLRVLIREPNNCDDADPSRKTTVQILRVFRDGTESKETILATKEFPRNPMCPQSPFTLDIAEGTVKFSCLYYGSEGTTSSQYSWGPLPNRQ